MTTLIIIIVALIALVLYLYFYRRKEKISGYNPYLEALTALLDNNKELALKKLKETVSVSSDLIDPYIRLGNLYRKMGDIPRAIQIHQSLTVRPTLKKSEEKRIYYALVQDLLEAHRPLKAVSYLKEILKIDKNDPFALKMILRIYEDMGNFKDCITIYEDKNFKPKEKKRQAFYYASLANKILEGLSQDDQDSEKEALNLLNRASKIDPNSLTTLYYTANYFENKGELKKAREYYLKIMEFHPDYAFMIIPRFEKVYFELGEFDDIISIYERIYNKSPKNFSVGFALANLYEKKNDIESAKDIYQKLGEAYPETVVPKLSLLRLMIDDDTIKEKIYDIEKVIPHNAFVCKKCKNRLNKFTLLCPKCRAIESYLPSL